MGGEEGQPDKKKQGDSDIEEVPEEYKNTSLRKPLQGSFLSIYHLYGSANDSQNEKSAHQTEEKKGDIQDANKIDGERMKKCATFAGLEIAEVHIGGRVGHIKVRDNSDNAHPEKTMMIKCWFLNRDSIRSERPRLLIIFADRTNHDDNLKKKITEIHRYSKKNRLACHLLALKILIIENIVVVHKDTSHTIVKILLDFNEIKLNRGHIDDNEGEVMYFKRMAEHCTTDLCLPVKILLRDDNLEDIVRGTAQEELIPAISFKEEFSKAEVIAFKINADSSEQKHKFDIKTSGKEKGQKWTQLCPKNNPNANEKINELLFKGDLSIDVLVCYLLISVCSVPAGTPKKELQDDDYEIYPNALAMHLLKEGKWNIPKNKTEGFISRKSIDYIYERKMGVEIENGIWQDLSKKSNGAYIPPWKKSDSKIDKEEGGIIGQIRRCMLMNKGNGSDNSKNDDASEIYSMVFYALLQEKFYNGAKQLIETGCVRMQYILVGCVILKESEEDWRTTNLDKEKMKQLQRIFTHQALRILSCIRGNGKNSDEEQDRHAGRLLLNHGCLSNAIKTKNTTFLGDNAVRDTLNQIWYGEEKLTVFRCFLFLLLTLLHVVLLPLLMITMENGPLNWLCRYYKIPVMKVLLHLVGLLALLSAYAYMLLFDFVGHGLSVSDFYIVTLMGSFFIDEIKQMVVASYRDKLWIYISDRWNILDWMSVGTYLCGMLLKFGEGINYANSSRIVLTLAFAMLCIRVLNLFCISKRLGPTLVIIQKMILDTFGFMAIMGVITICYNVSYYTILYTENSDFTLEEIAKITRNGYWMLFGELNLETDRLTEPECTLNKTVYTSGAMERCPSALGRYLAPYFKAIYGFVVVIIMLNLLIAKYSNSFSRVQEKSKIYWTQLQTKFLEEYSIKSIFPMQLQIPALFAFILQLFVWLFYSFLCRSKLRCCERNEEDPQENGNGEWNDKPMFVKVFLFDTNFDIELQQTREVEDKAALSMQGKMEKVEKDILTVLQDALKEIKNELTEERKEHDKVSQGVQNDTKDILPEKNLPTK